MKNPLMRRLLAGRLPETAQVSALLARVLPGKAPATAPKPPAGGTVSTGLYTGPAGSRPWRLFVPGRLPPRPALLVMLHGCTQSAEDFAAGTRMDRLADHAGLLVLYPEQVAAANPQRCWNWFNAAEQQGATGEAALLAGMVRDTLQTHGADPARVFVAGLSAGGAQAVNLACRFPELFAAIGVHSGLASGAASDLRGAMMAMSAGRPGQGGHAIRTFIVHGDRDTTVNPRNAGFVADQMAGPASGRGSQRTMEAQSPGGLAYTRLIRSDAAGRPMLERWTVHGLGHAWSGGSAAGSYTDPAGPDASMGMLEFFLR